VLPALGSLSVNANIAIDRLSDFGALTTTGFGANWRPRDGIELIFSQTDEQGAPTIQQLGDPQVLTPNVRVFDFVRGETVDISRLDGGNAALVADRRRVRKLGATLRPFTADLSLSANFIDSRIENPIVGFPTATAELEAAFPDRFQRGSDGRLLRIDNRSVNFTRADRQELRWGFIFSEALEPGKAASLLVLDADPLADGDTLRMGRTLSPAQPPARGAVARACSACLALLPALARRLAAHAPADGPAAVQP
jgi:hypothetical protein